MKIKTLSNWIIRIIIAGILAQTLFFKFTGAEESIWIFTQLSVEPWGRILTGVIEIIAVALILFPKTVLIGASISAGLMIGAIVSHLIILGIEIQGDGGLLFFLAILTLFLSILTIFLKVNNDDKEILKQ